MSFNQVPACGAWDCQSEGKERNDITVPDTKEIRFFFKSNW